MLNYYLYHFYEIKLMRIFYISCYSNNNVLFQVEEYLGDFFFAIAAAIVLSLLMEAPTLAMEKIILHKDREYKTVDVKVQKLEMVPLA